MKKQLAHVYWLGGSPCSGKSSIVDLLAGRWETTVYHCDDHFDTHLQRTTPQEQPEFHRITYMTWDDLWRRPVEEQVRHELAIYREQFPMILADLLALPKDRPILVEGAALLPELVADVSLEPRQAYFVVPTPAFQWATYAKRPWIQGILQQCRDPEQAFANWMKRVIGFGEVVAETAVTHHFPVIHVDGQTSIAANAAAIAAHWHLSSPGD